MGKLIASTQATLDGVVDPVGEWVQPDGDHGEYSFERQSRSAGLVLARKTYEGLAASPRGDSSTSSRSTSTPSSGATRTSTSSATAARFTCASRT